MDVQDDLKKQIETNSELGLKSQFCRSRDKLTVHAVRHYPGALALPTANPGKYGGGGVRTPSQELQIENLKTS